MSTSTVHPPAEELSTSTAPALRMSLGSQKLFTMIAIFAMLIGAGSVLGGIAGAVYTWDQAAAQDITTPDDARIAGAPVRGPLTMWSQSDIITHHQLDGTGGLHYSQMEREVPAVDEEGNPAVTPQGTRAPDDVRARVVCGSSRPALVTVCA